MRSARLPALLVLAAGGFVAACSGAGASASPTTTTGPTQVASAAPSASAESSAAASAPASAGASAGAAATLNVTAKDFSFELPASVPAGVTQIAVSNTGAEEHQAQLVRLADRKTMADLTAALQNPDPSAALQLVTLEGGPNAIAPGANGTATANLKPGAYAFLGFISSPDGVPHIAKGMIAPLEVTGTATTDQVPAGDASLTLKDFSFDLTSLTAGKHTISVQNDGPQPHEAVIVKLADGVTVDTLKSMITAPPAASGAPDPSASAGTSEAPPFTEVGGITGISPGSLASFDVDLPPGNYAFLCFVPDPATGKAHAELGMIGALTVQ